MKSSLRYGGDACATQTVDRIITVAAPRHEQAALFIRIYTIGKYCGLSRCRVCGFMMSSTYWEASMARTYTRVHRLFRLIGLVQSGRQLRVGDMARICEISPRMIYRDLNNLEAAGFPICFDREGDTYRMSGGIFMPPLELNYAEALALLALAEQVRGGRIPFTEPAARAIEKIRGQLPRALVEEIAPLDHHMAIDLARSGEADGAQNVYECVRRAIITKRKLQCRYEAVASKVGAEAQAALFELCPYVLWYCQRAWYVVGYHSGRKEVRRLKLARFAMCKATDKPYGIPDDFTLEKHLGLAWRMIRGEKRYEVAVRFDTDFAETVCDTRWHATQREEFHEDGSVTLRFTVDGLEEIVWWVMGYGGKCRVLEPAELARRVRAMHGEAAARYQK
jgi:proteasome accessory factor B